MAKIDAARNEQTAAKIQSATADERKIACENAGFKSEQYCLGFLQLQWLQNLNELPSNFILNLGGSQAVPAVNMQSAPVTP